MKIRVLFLRAALLLAIAVSFGALTSCTTAEPRHPGPHQTSETGTDGKDIRVGTTGPHQGS